MGRIYRSSPPAGTDLGLAFSGGLDTRCAALWLAQKGLRVHAYTADLAQPDEASPEDILPIATSHGAVSAKLVDCKEDLAKEGLIAIQCGAFHVVTAGRRYFNTTPLGRAVTATAIVRAMRKDGVNVFGDGSTHRGNDIQRFYRYGVLVNPELHIYKPWLDEVFVKELGGRKEMSEFLAKNDRPYSMSTEKAYSTDSNLLGATHEAKKLEELTESVLLVQPIMGVAFWKQDIAIAPERVELEYLRGVPVAINGKKFGTTWELVKEANEVGGRHGLGMSDQIENRVIEAKSRGIYEAPGMALLSIGYERLLTAVHNESTTEMFATLGRKLGRLLYEGRWFDPEAMLLKEGLTKWVAPALSGTVVLELRRGEDYSILSTKPVFATYGADKLSMEKTKGTFAPEDRIGALEVLNLSIEDTRALTFHLIEHEDATKDGKGLLKTFGAKP